MTRVIIGCPVRQRNWVLPIWREYALQSKPENVDLSFAFVVGVDDHETIDLLSSWPDTSLIPVEEPELKFNRDWGDKSRYHHMVYVRNTLLSYIRMKRPDFFFSLDSDILVGRDTLSQLIDTSRNRDFDGVAGLTFLDRADKTCTNAANFVNNKSFYKRVVSNGVHPVDIIMAVKLMNPNAYSIDYSYNKFGEDVGWSKNAKEAGLTLGMDGRSPNKHIMKIDDLERIDKRVGW